MRIGIMGGTFDPIHNAHLFLAEEARVSYSLERVLFVPNGNPPHKEGELLTSAEHRFAMTEIAIAGNPYFFASRLELDRAGIVYTYDTLRLLQEEYPSAKIYYLTGIDTVLEMLTWHRPQEVLKMAQFIAATRPGFDSSQIAERLPESFEKRISLLPTTELNISSTEIRARVRKGKPIRYLTPERVVDYIEAHRLYLNEGVRERAYI